MSPIENLVTEALAHRLLQAARRTFTHLPAPIKEQKWVRLQYYRALRSLLQRVHRYEEALICLEAEDHIGGHIPNEKTSEDLLAKINEPSYKKTGVYNDQKYVQTLRKTYLHHPQGINLETAAICNARCTFCPYPTISRKGQKLSDQLINKIITELSTYPADVPFTIALNHINEPLLDSRLPTVMDNLQKEVPWATLHLFSNGSTLSDKNVAMLRDLPRLASLEISLNEIDPDRCQKVMGLNFIRTAAHLDKLHALREAKELHFPVTIRRVGNNSAADEEFVEYCANRWPCFNIVSRVLKDFIGAIEIPPPHFPVPNLSPRRIPVVPCPQWFRMVITATGEVAHCCFDGHSAWPFGNIRDQSLLDIYNQSLLGHLRKGCFTRLEAPDPCSRCTIHWGEMLHRPSAS